MRISKINIVLIIHTLVTIFISIFIYGWFVATELTFNHSLWSDKNLVEFVQSLWLGSWIANTATFIMGMLMHKTDKVLCDIQDYIEDL